MNNYFLLMTNIETLKRKLNEVLKFISIVEGYQRYDMGQLSTDVTLRGAVERYLYLLTQSTIDLGEMIVSFFKYRKPSTYADIFEILFENKLISKELLVVLKKMTGFRNILTHAYGEVNIELVYQVLQKDVPNITLFLSEIRKNVPQFNS